MATSLKALLAVGLLVLLGACGGGGNGSSGGGEAGMAEGAPPTRVLPTVITSEGRLLNTCSFIAECSGNPLAPFFSSVTMAPANGATLSGLVRIEVRGNEMANVELLPATGYLPRIGVFNITGDRTVAWLDLDTTRLPNGPASVRVSAFNAPAGQAGAEIFAMPVRTWNINNTTPQPAVFSAALFSAPAPGAVVSGTTRLEVRGSGIANAELLPATGYAPRLGVFNVSPDRTRAWLDFDSRSLADGMRDVRISVFNVTQGQPGATEIIAMPARRWNLRNGLSGLSPPFTASVTLAPVHGEIVSGRARLEVRGSGMRNVELLPASGYLPVLGKFNVSFDGSFAWLEFESASLPNGRLETRISAFNVAPGQPGAREIGAMPARTWVLRH